MVSDWIEWYGSDARPVPYDELVEVRYLYSPRADQVAITECFAGFFDWRHTQENDDIIAYRVLT